MKSKQNLKKENPSTRFPNLDDFFMQELSRGIAVKYADVIFGKHFIFTLTPQNWLLPCVIYQGVLSAQEHKKGKVPIIHFCHCDALWSEFDKDSIKLKAIVPKENSFDYKILQNKAEIKLFYGVKLDYCPKCIEIYEKLFLRFNIPKNMNLWNLLFSSKRTLKMEQIAIEDKISINSDFSPMEIHASEGRFRLKYKKDLYGVS